jgi:hypothetical protein
MEMGGWVCPSTIARVDFEFWQGGRGGATLALEISVAIVKERSEGDILMLKGSYSGPTCHQLYH